MTAASVILYFHRAFISEVLKFDPVLKELGLLKDVILPDGTHRAVPDADRRPRRSGRFSCRA